MASGVIIGRCHICKELIWEDEEYIERSHQLNHKECCGTLEMTKIALMLMKLNKLQKERILSLLETLIQNDEYEQRK